jgi:hypothetical protein
MLKQLDDACQRADQEAIRTQLRKIVPEFAPSSDIDEHIWKKTGGAVTLGPAPHPAEIRA